MKKKLNDVYLFYANNWFKINIMIVTITITFFIYKISLNGRYINVDRGVLDTRTGKIYLMVEKNLIEEYEFIKSK